MANHSKRFRKLADKVKGPMELDAAVKLLKEFANTKFDQSIEVAMNLGVDPRQADQLVRGALSLPAGIGKTVRIAVFARNENADKATAAGADVVGADDLAKRVREGFVEFDVALATPDMMGVVGPLGKVLGPKGLMPTPKNGTVTADIAKAVSEFKAGKIEYRTDPTGNIHCLVGKLSFSPDKIATNVSTFVNHIRNARPAAVKGQFVLSVTLSATMSPGIPLII
jgi:large subunit ribosomal protein L1